MIRLCAVLIWSFMAMFTPVAPMIGHANAADHIQAGVTIQPRSSTDVPKAAVDDKVYAAVISLGGALIAALAGAFAGAIAASYFDGKLFRHRNTFDLHKEFHSKDMMEARAAAWKFIRENPGVPAEQLRVIGLRNGEFVSVWRVIQIFNSIATAWKLGHIENKRMLELFGEPLVWWWVIYFKKAGTRCGDAGTKWGVPDNIQQLYLYCKKEAERNRLRRAEWKKWHELAEQDADVAADETTAGTSTGAVGQFAPIGAPRVNSLTQ